MKIFGKVLVCLWSLRLLFCGILCSPSPKDEGDSQTSLVSDTSELPQVLLFHPDVENNYDQLPALSKLLSDLHQQELGDGMPGPRPDSKALRYMKRLYKMSTTKEGFPKAKTSHLYNTVRLLTPCAEGKHPTMGQTKGDLRSPDFVFNLEHVTALEHSVKSVLLYSFDKPFSKSLTVTCTCNLVVKTDVASDQAHPNIAHAKTFHFKLGRKRVEIDVTSFIWSLIASNNRSVYMAVTITCPKDDQLPNSKQDPFNMTRASLSLLLYLNDTSEQAYHTWDFLKHRRKNSMWSWLERVPFAGLSAEAEKQSTKRPRHRRDEERQEESISVSIDNIRKYYEQFLFPQNECKLHNFRLQFSQLNWDRWIIAPHRYNPRYCKGDCPRVLGYHYSSPVHSMVQNIIHEQVNPSVPRPSCIPAEYSPLSVLMIEPDGSIVYKEYADMIATKCTCR